MAGGTIFPGSKKVSLGQIAVFAESWPARVALQFSVTIPTVTDEREAFPGRFPLRAALRGREIRATSSGLWPSVPSLGEERAGNGVQR